MSSTIIDNTSGKFEIQEFNVGDIFARSIQSSIELPWVALGLVPNLVASFS